MSYQENIDRGLEGAMACAPIRALDLNQSRMVIFSDHHKGAGDDADDFKASADVYQRALRYYEQEGYTLAILGDAEELWECRPAEVTATHPEVFRCEKPFHESDRYVRIFGNHDDDWQYPDQIERHLGQFFDQLVVYESMRYSVYEGVEYLGTILMVHGHQGTALNDRYGALSRFVVRYLWRPFQRLTNIKSTTPATNWRLRYKHDIAMYNWAVRQSGLILIAGHTHKPIFPSPERVEELSEQYSELTHQPETPAEETLDQLSADLAFAKAQEQPCYLNSGCCSFSDGSITGIEIDRGEIRLIRWQIQDSSPVRSVLDKAGLKAFLSAVAAPAAVLPASIGELD